MTSNLSISAISDKEEKRENSKAFLYEKVHLLKKKKTICAEYFAYLVQEK